MFAKIPLLNKLFANSADEATAEHAKPEVSEGAFRIGVLGAANIAPGAIIEPSLKIKDCVVYAVAARNKDKATAFAATHNIEKVFDSYEALIDSDEIDIVFNPLPNGYHAYYSVLALKKGKHVLCEKPLTSNVTEIASIRKALEIAPLNPKTKTKPIIIEAFHDKYHPLFRKILNLTKAKHFGDIEEISVDFLIPWWRISKKDIRFNCNGEFPELGGGTFMDLGCYNTSIFRMIATEDLLVGEDQSKVSLDFRIIDSEMKEMFKKVKGIDKALNATVELFKTKAVEGSTEQKEVKKVVGKFKTSFNSWKFSMSFTIKGTKKKLKVVNSLSAHNWHKVEEYDVETKKKTTWTEYGVDKSSDKPQLSATYDHQLHHFIETLKGNKDSEKLCESIGGLDMATKNMKMIDEIYKKAGAQPRLGKKGLEELVK